MSRPRPVLLPGSKARRNLALAFTLCAFAAGRSAAAPDSATGGERTICGAPSGARLGFDTHGALAVPADGAASWSWGLSLRRFGSPSGFRDAEAMPAAAGTEATEIRRGPVTEWFRCDGNGIEHRLEIGGAAALSDLLVLEFAVEGSLAPKVSEDGRTLRFRGRAGHPLVTARGVAARDAEGREVDARWERIEGSAGSAPVVWLILEARGHVFPIHIAVRLGSKGPAAPSPAGRPERFMSAGAPANDTCAGAAVVPPAGPFPYLAPVVDVATATGDGDPPAPACQPDVSHGVWYTFTPASDGAYSFSVCSDAPTATTLEDTVLALYATTGPCAGLTAVPGACSDDACGPGELQSSLTAVPLTAGVAYALVVWTYGGTAPPAGQSDVQLRVEREAPGAPPPANDRCEGAETIPASGPFPSLSTITADISGATSAGDPPLPSCQPDVSRSIWYRFTPAIGGRYVFAACADAPTGSTVDDTVVAVYLAGAGCSAPIEVPGGCDDDSCGFEAAQSRTAPLTLIAGATYYAVVWKYGVAAPAAGHTAVQLRVESVSAPANDTCAAPAALPLERSITGSTVAAFDDTRLPSNASCFQGPGQTVSAGAGRDVVYRFTAAESGRYSFRVTPSAASANFVLYAASACPATPPPSTVTDCLAAANRTTTQPEEIDCLTLAAGQSIFVTVDEDAATAGTGFVIEASRCLLESEPNGAPAAAGALGCVIEGSVAPAGDADFFALGTPAAGSRLFAIVDGAAAGSADFDLRAVTAVDTIEYDDFNNDAPFGSNAPNLSGTPLPGAPAYLRVSHYSPVAQSSPYRLCATLRPPASQAVPEAEPNDAVVSATAGSAGYLSGALAGPADIDLFAFDAAAGELVQIGLDLDPARDGTPFNGSLALLDATGGSLLVVNDASIASSTQPGGGSLAAATPYSPGEALLYRIRTTGTHFTKVALSSGTPGDYLLSIARHAPAGPPDGDGDGTPDDADCAPADPDAWALPGEATALQLAAGGAGLLQWSAPADAGGRLVLYDLLRSTRANDWQGAVCLTAGSTATTGTDAAVPAAAFFYLVRSRNACGGNLGHRSDGGSRSAPPCP